MRDRSEIKLLTIDDDPVVLKSIALYFEDSGYHVITAENGRLGLERFREEHPDVMLVDIRMPEINGLDVLATVAKEAPHTPIIMVSSTNTIQDAIEALRLHAWDFVTKPVYDMEVLERAVAKAVEKSDLIKENHQNRKQLETQADELRSVNQRLQSEVSEHKSTLVNLEESVESYRLLKDELAALNLSLEKRVHEQTDELAKKLITDDLTGLYNKLKLDMVLRERGEMVLLLIGLDNFAQINTYYGFETGDEILKTVASFLNEHKPSDSILFRRTSSEFVLLMPGKPVETANEVARELHQKIFNQNFILDSGISFQGTATIVVSEGKKRDILKLAHMGMMESKRIGRNRVFLLTKDMVIEERQRSNMQWMNRVRKALQSDLIIPFFQPIVNNQTGQVSKFECLSRIVKDGEVISPYLFIDAAKMVGVIHDLTKVIIRKSFDAFKNTPFEFSINITEDDLKEGSLVTYMTSLFQKVSIAPDRVVFEVLEGISLTDSDNVLEQLTALKEMGCKIAIDDFGAEQSNFSRLLELNADFIKIDGKFIKNIHTDPKSYTITKAITRLAKDIGTKVIAEFVHCEQVQEKITELGIEYSQGYYFGKPKQTI